MKRSQSHSFQELMSGQLGLVTFDQVIAAGGTRSLIRHEVDIGRWAKVAPGVYGSTAAPASDHRSVLAMVLSCGPEARASHETAAALAGITGYVLDPERVHVTVPMGRQPTATAAIVHYTRAFPPDHGVVVDSIPATTVARTLFDLARITPRARLEQAIDAALAAKLVSLAQLRRAYLELAGPGRAGVVLMRSLLEERGDGFVAPASRLERRFMRIVEQYGLPQPRREIDHGTTRGWNGRCEFTFDPAVLVEIDARRWHSALGDLDRDARRDNEFASSGYVVLRFRYADLSQRPAEVAEIVQRAISTQQHRRAS